MTSHIIDPKSRITRDELIKLVNERQKKLEELGATVTALSGKCSEMATREAARENGRAKVRTMLSADVPKDVRDFCANWLARS